MDQQAEIFIVDENAGIDYIFRKLYSRGFIFSSELRESPD